jgi:hypothetical protein
MRTLTEPPLHPALQAGELDSASDPALWEAFNAAAGSAVAGMMWHLAAGARRMHPAERLALLALAFHVDLSVAARHRYEGTKPTDLCVFTGRTVGGLREMLKHLSKYGWCVLVEGSRPMRFRPNDQVMKWAGLSSEEA